jgi:hypothetical protein
MATKARSLSSPAFRRCPNHGCVPKRQFDDKAANFWSLSRPIMASEEEKFSLR